MVSDLSLEDTPDILFHLFRHVMREDDHASLRDYHATRLWKVRYDFPPTAMDSHLYIRSSLLTLLLLNTN